VLAVALALAMAAALAVAWVVALAPLAPPLVQGMEVAPVACHSLVQSRLGQKNLCMHRNFRLTGDTIQYYRCHSHHNYLPICSSRHHLVSATHHLVSVTHPSPPH
jgi:hypothetical protein